MFVMFSLIACKEDSEFDIKMINNELLAMFSPSSKVEDGNNVLWMHYYHLRSHGDK